MNFIITSYAMEIHASTYIIEPLNISRFDSNNPLHQKLSELSQKAHEMAKKIYEEGREDLKEDLKRIEEEIDKIVAELYGITDEELKEIRKCLMILKEGEIPEEEEEGGEEEEITLQEKELEVSVEPLLINEGEERELKCIILNNMDKDIKDVEVEILLDKKKLASEKIGKIEKISSKTTLFNTPKLEAGQYELAIKIKIDKNLVEEKRKLFVKKRGKKKELKSALDEEIEGMLGELK